ncbi:MAG: hypothetical protein V1744_01775 [Candidatus Altiarchaeota archaeon]
MAELLQGNPPPRGDFDAWKLLGFFVGFMLPLAILSVLALVGATNMLPTDFGLLSTFGGGPDARLPTPVPAAEQMSNTGAQLINSTAAWGDVGEEELEQVCDTSGRCVPDCRSRYYPDSDGIGRCYARYVIKKGSIQACLDVPKSSVGSCAKYYSVSVNNFSVCTELGERAKQDKEQLQLKINCYWGLASVNNNFSYCDYISEKEYMTWNYFCVNDVLMLKKAYGRFEIEMCEHHLWAIYRDTCYRDYSTRPEHCDKIESGYSSDWCLLNVVKLTGDKSICEKITDDIIQGHCFAGKYR